MLFTILCFDLIQNLPMFNEYLIGFVNNGGCEFEFIGLFQFWLLWLNQKYWIRAVILNQNNSQAKVGEMTCIRFHVWIRFCRMSFEIIL